MNLQKNVPFKERKIKFGNNGGVKGVSYRKYTVAVGWGGRRRRVACADGWNSCRISASIELELIRAGGLC